MGFVLKLGVEAFIMVLLLLGFFDELFVFFLMRRNVQFFDVVVNRRRLSALYRCAF